MKILQISTCNMGGEDISTITHQEGWDFRNTKSDGGYIRWFTYPFIGNTTNSLYLRGGKAESDHNPLIGKIQWDKITDFFNSENSPLDLDAGGKRWIMTFGDDGNDIEDLNDHFGAIGDPQFQFWPSEVVNGDKLHYLTKVSESEKPPRLLVLVKPRGEFVLGSIHNYPKLLDYLASKFTFTKPKTKKVVMTKVEDTVRGVKVEVRTWTLK